MEDRRIRRERAQNLWTSFARKFEPIERATSVDPLPSLELDRVGGLAGPKEEILTYGCAATSPEVYAHWGTYPPSGMLLIGQRGVGKRLLAKALASNTQTAFVRIRVPRLVIEVIHRGGKIGQLIRAWSETISELPPTTVLFDELEFSQAAELGSRRPDLPVGPVMDFLLDLIERTIDAEEHLVLASTSHPDTLRHAFVEPGRFERVVEVNPVFPDDIVAAIQIHAEEAEKRAGRPLFDHPIDWSALVSRHRGPTPGDWVRVLHNVLRRKARCEAGRESPTPITGEDLKRDADAFQQASQRLSPPGRGIYV